MIAVTLIVLIMAIDLFYFAFTGNIITPEPYIVGRCLAFILAELVVELFIITFITSRKL